jgi:hypothetical protein
MGVIETHDVGGEEIEVVYSKYGLPPEFHLIGGGSYREAIELEKILLDLVERAAEYILTEMGSVVL